MAIDLWWLQSATNRAKQTCENISRRAKDCDVDADRVARLKTRLCPWCYYHRSRVAGQAFTSWKCRACEREQSHPNMATPELCEGCSKQLNACRDCCASLDLKVPRKLPNKDRDQ